MTPDQHERIGRLFRDALELPAGERSTFLSRSCNGDAVLQREVESLLSYEAVGHAVIDGSAFEAVGRAMAVEQSLSAARTRSTVRSTSSESSNWRGPGGSPRAPATSSQGPTGSRRGR